MDYLQYVCETCPNHPVMPTDADFINHIVRIHGWYAGWNYEKTEVVNSVMPGGLFDKVDRMNFGKFIVKKSEGRRRLDV